MTGQNEITGVCKRLEARFSRRAIEQRKKRKLGRLNIQNDMEDAPSYSAVAPSDGMGALP
jgi:ATP-dependent RNA helicase DHX37/DHR1